MIPAPYSALDAGSGIVRYVSSSHSRFLPSFASCRSAPDRAWSVSGRIVGAELDQPGGHGDGPYLVERTRCHLEREAAVEEARELPGRVGQDEEELICSSRVPVGTIAPADRGSHTFAELRQHLIPDLVRESLVDRAEVVEVDLDQRERAAVAPGRTDLARQGLLERKRAPDTRPEVRRCELLNVEKAEGVFDRRRGLPGDGREDRHCVGVERILVAGVDRERPVSRDPERDDKTGAQRVGPFHIPGCETCNERCTVRRAGEKGRSALRGKALHRGLDDAVSSSHPDRAAVDRREGGGCCEGAVEYLVELDRRADCVTQAGGRLAAESRGCLDSLREARDAQIDPLERRCDACIVGPPRGEQERDEHADNTDGTQSRNDYRSRDPSPFP